MSDVNTIENLCHLFGKKVDDDPLRFEVLKGFASSCPGSRCGRCHGPSTTSSMSTEALYFYVGSSTPTTALSFDV
jgi:hypothetical protein